MSRKLKYVYGFLVFIFVVYIVGIFIEVYPRPAFKIKRHENAQNYCNFMKMDCQAIICQSNTLVGNCDVKVNNNLIILSCSQEQCEFYRK